ncbi:MAG: glycosyltransferase family 39 protein [Candidatus Omnitrophica bacterium]|nr:glycosyltransferase family 39 protein [Candidatus Omnitrophota bacterium]
MINKYRTALFLIIPAAVLLLAMTFKDIRYLPRADEGCYFQYASQVAQKGLSGFAEIFKEYVSNPQCWICPNPLRIVFIGISAFWLNLAGHSLPGLSYLSLLFYGLFLLVSYYFSRKYLGEWFALALLLLLAFSPIQMAMGRRVLAESAANFFSVFSIWLFWDFLNRKSPLKFAFFIAVYSCSILTRESALILTVPFLVMLSAGKFSGEGKGGLKYIPAVLLLPPLIALAAYALLGCFPYLGGAVNIAFGPPRINPYALLCGSGPWYRYVIDYMVLSPWTVILAIGFIFYFILSRPRERMASYFMVIFLFSFILLNCFAKNLRYAMPLDLPLRLFALLMLKALAGRFFGRQADKAVLAAALLVSALDYLSFYHLFIGEAVYDPASFFLLKAVRMVPFN